MGQDSTEGNLFGFRKHGIIQRTGTASPMPESERKAAIYELSEEPLDLEKKGSKPPSKEKVRDPREDKVIEFGLESAKVIDREDEGILEFGVDGSKPRPGKAKVRRQTTIKDLKKPSEGGPKLDYISIDEEGGKQHRNAGEAKATDAPKEEEKEDLDYIPIDDDDPAWQKKKAPQPKEPGRAREQAQEEDDDLPMLTPLDTQTNYDPKELKELRPKDMINCPHCRSKIEIPSPKRPITVKCPGCGKKGTLRY